MRIRIRAGTVGNSERMAAPAPETAALLLASLIRRRRPGIAHGTFRRAVIHPLHKGVDFGLRQFLALCQDHVVGGANDLAYGTD